MFMPKPRFVIILAIMSGLIGSYAVFTYLKRQEEKKADPAPAFKRVVVAAYDLRIGETLDQADLKLGQWPVDIVPPGSHTEPGLLEGRVLKNDVFAGEAILDFDLAPEGSNGGVLSLIPPGMRALTVAVNVVSGVGGFILPKTRVDVLSTLDPSGDNGDRMTKIILQNIEVLAVDQTYRKNDDDPMEVKSVTLLITPEDAEKLALAANEGDLRLSLRSSADSEIIETPGQKLSKLFSGPEKEKPRKVVYRPRKPAPKPKEPPQPRVVEVIRGSDRSTITFEDEEGEDSSKKD